MTKGILYVETMDVMKVNLAIGSLTVVVIIVDTVYNNLDVSKTYNTHGVFLDLSVT